MYLVARSKDYKKVGFIDNFSVKNAAYLCEDYFMRTRPQIQYVNDIIKIACKSTNER
jgi:hypothetical protein